ncbi:MAG: tetratricopeptide repeat protein [Nitrospirae bacterium]|nr:tetratricopeptide repeat protein [Nitrospirota bacterium]
MNLDIKIEFDKAVNKNKIAIGPKGLYYINPASLTLLLKDTANGLWHNSVQSAIDLGSRLYDILNGLEKLIESGLKEAIRKNEPLTIYLEVPVEFYALPFELIYNGDFLLLGADIQLIWLVNRRGQTRGRQTRRGQMKLLFMACAPTDLPEDFDYEREEEEIARGIERYPVELTVETTGSLRGLHDTIVEGMGYDVLHITGAAAIRRDEGPIVYMEDDTGNTQRVTPDMLWESIYSYPPLLCLLSGCSMAGVEGSNIQRPFAWQLVDRGIPFALGWSGVVKDDEATKVAVEFYRALAIGKGIYDAVYAARRVVRELPKVWAGLRLLCDGTSPTPLVKPGQARRGISMRRARHVYLKNTGIRVLEAGFVGRRLELQRAIRVLRGETDRYGVAFHGPAGVGKSCLAGKVIERLSDKELVTFKGVVTTGGVISALRGLFERVGLEVARDILKAEIVYGDKVKGLFRSAFKEVGVIILFDDFEANLERVGNRFAFEWYDSWIAGSKEPDHRYLEEAIHHALEVGNVRGACRHAVAVGEYYNSRVLYREGLAILEEVVARVSDSVIVEAKESKDGGVADLLDQYASTLDRLGDSKKAIDFHEKALAIVLGLYGEKHQYVANSYNNIGIAWDSLGDLKKAIEFYQKALTIRLEVHGDKHPEVACSYNNIGYICNNLGDSNKAIEFHKKALDIWLEVYGDKHPHVATSYNNLASVFRTLGDTQKATQYAVKAKVAWP